MFCFINTSVYGTLDCAGFSSEKFMSFGTYNSTEGYPVVYPCPTKKETQGSQRGEECVSTASRWGVRIPIQACLTRGLTVHAPMLYSGQGKGLLRAQRKQRRAVKKMRSAVRLRFPAESSRLGCVTFLCLGFPFCYLFATSIKSL